MSAETYDFAIIGAGSVGLIAADFAMELGARVALLERDRIGGGHGAGPRVPPVYHPPDLPAHNPGGLEAKGPGHFSWGGLLRRSAHPECRVAADHGKEDPHRDWRRAGASSLPRLNEVSFSTYRQIFESDRLPDSMVVIGGGPVGVEVAQAYQLIGTRVTIFAERLLPKEEPDASAILLRVLQREGLHIVAESALSVVARSGNRTRVHSQHHQVRMRPAPCGRRVTRPEHKRVRSCPGSTRQQAATPLRNHRRPEQECQGRSSRRQRVSTQVAGFGSSEPPWLFS
jgi:hypothetical protein